ncbi:NLP/P60 protein [Parafrankia sp. EAN1pec]|nr:NLP/P60 protein [Frankia sp. EAN1pec]
MTSPPTAKSGRSSTATTAMAPADPRCHTAVVPSTTSRSTVAAAVPAFRRQLRTVHRQARTERSLDVSMSKPRIPRLQYPAHGADLLKCSAAVDKYSSTSGFGADTAPSDAGYAAVVYAQGQLGIPYLWGGDGPAEGGFDCSGLTRAAYLAAGIDLPRTAQTQYEAGPVVPPGEPLQIGDLVYYGTATNIHHVAIYIGNGQMITAPGRNKVVKIAGYRWQGDDYFGATRPGM